MGLNGAKSLQALQTPSLAESCLLETVDLDSWGDADFSDGNLCVDVGLEKCASFLSCINFYLVFIIATLSAASDGTNNWSELCTLSSLWEWPDKWRKSTCGKFR